MHRFCRFALICLPALLAGCGGDDDYALPTDDVAGAPSLTSVTMSDRPGDSTAIPASARMGRCGPNTAYEHQHRIVSVHLEASETILPPTVLIAGSVATSVSGSGSSWTASRELRPGDIEGDVSVRILYRDRVGNPGEEVTALTSGTPYAWNNPQYRECWLEEFVGDRLSERNWNIQLGDGTAEGIPGWGNNELQLYEAGQIEVGDGKLTITADEVSMGQYRSARINTKGKQAIGPNMRVEVRAKLPQGQGIWPAIWMLPTDDAYGGWPLSGEIDIVEAVNLGTMVPEATAPKRTIHSSVHYGLPWPNHQRNGQDYEPPANPQDGFHNYAMEWEIIEPAIAGDPATAEMRFYFDGVHFATHTSDNWFTVRSNEDGSFSRLPNNPIAPFDREFHLLMNVAVGGNWPGSPNESTTFPQTLEVEWVRVSECAWRHPELGCATSRNPDVDAVKGADDANIHTLTFYEGTEVSALTFTVGGSTYTNTLGVGSYNPNGEVTVNERNAMDPDDPTNSVWQLQFVGGIGNAYITSEDLSEHELLNTGLNLRGADLAGLLIFDMYVEMLSPGTSLLVKMDSGWPNLGQVTLDLTDDDGMVVTGEWRTYSIPIGGDGGLAHSSNALDGGSGLDLTKVLNPFVIEPANETSTSTIMANIYLDNIRLTTACKQDANCMPRNRVQAPPLSGDLVVFGDALDDDWGVFHAFDEARTPPYSDCIDDGGEGCPSISWSLVDAADTARGKVVEVTYPADAQFAGLVVGGDLATPQNLTNYATGELRFDVLMIANPANVSLIVKVDCEGCSNEDNAREQTLPMAELNVWTAYTVEISRMVNDANAPLQLDKVSSGMVIFPPFGMTAGVSFRLDNVRYFSSEVGPGGPSNPGAGAVYADAIDEQWAIKLSAFDQATGFSDCPDDGGAACPSLSYSQVDAADTVRGKVIEVTYADTAQFAGMIIGQKTDGLDFSGFAGGTLNFDLMVTANPGNANFKMKADCVGCPTDAGQREQSLGMPPLNTWMSYSIRVDRMVNANGGPGSGGLVLGSVTTGLVIFPEFGSEFPGINYQLDNVRWEAAGASP